jgi:hypothetical protein
LAQIPNIADHKVDAELDLWDFVPREKLKLRGNRVGHAGSQPDSFATSAFAIRYEFSVPPFPTLYQRLNDISNPSDTETIRDLVARDILAGTFIGNDFSEQFAIDDCCNNFLTIDTATGEPRIKYGQGPGLSADRAMVGHDLGRHYRYALRCQSGHIHAFTQHELLPGPHR